MGGGIGKSGSVRWRVWTSRPKENVKEKVDYEDKQQKKRVKNAVGFDDDDNDTFRVTLRVKGAQTEEQFLEEIARKLKPAGENAWEITVDSDGGPDQVRVLWGHGDNDPEKPPTT